MAWNTAYATKEEYKARVGKTTTGDDDTLDVQLASVSRFIEEQLGSKDAPRVFNQSEASTARYFDGNGLKAISVDDLVTLSAFAVDLDASGSWETSVDSGDLLLQPYQASEFSRPYTRIELAPWQTTVARIPNRAKALKITGTWGWPAVPGGIKEATVGLVRQLRDLHQSGVSQTVVDIESLVRTSPDARHLLNDIKRQYGRRSLFA